MLAPATGQKTPGCRQCAVFGFEPGQSVITAVVRIDIDGDEAGIGAAHDTYVGVRPACPPVANHICVGGRVL